MCRWHCQSWQPYDAVNKAVFRSRENSASNEAAMTDGGKAFQACAAATGKARSRVWRVSYGHIVRKEGSCMEKEIIQGTTPGQRRRGRPKTNWHDNIMEWTGLKGHCLLRSAEDRRQWWKIVHEAVNPRIKDHSTTTTTTTTQSVKFCTF